MLGQVDLPEGSSIDATGIARSQARPAALMDSWRLGEICTWISEGELELECRTLRELLVEWGPQVCEGFLELKKLEAARQRLATGRGG